MIAHYLFHFYNGNIEPNGIQPCYFWAVYTHPSRQKEAVSGIQPCYFVVVYTSDGGGCIQPCYFRTLYTQHRHIQFPKGAGIISHMITSQQSIPASTTTMHLHRR